VAVSPLPNFVKFHKTHVQTGGLKESALQHNGMSLVLLQIFRISHQINGTERHSNEGVCRCSQSAKFACVCPLEWTPTLLYRLLSSYNYGNYGNSQQETNQSDYQNHSVVQAGSWGKKVPKPLSCSPHTLNGLKIMTPCGLTKPQFYPWKTKNEFVTMCTNQTAGSLLTIPLQL
jgi:hypothetical protein